MIIAPSLPSSLRRVILAASIATLIGGATHAADITLGDGNSQSYTPSALTTTNGLTFRTFSGTAVVDTSLVNFGLDSTSFGLDAQVNQNTSTGQPVTTATQWVGKIDIAAAGDYTFFANSDDGSRIFIDDVLVVNNEGGHGAVEISKVLNLDAGLHSIRIELVNNGGGGGLAVNYSGPSIAKTPIPTTALFAAENHALVSNTVRQSNVTALSTGGGTDNITISAGANASISLDGTAYVAGGIGNLNLGAGSTLNATSAVAPSGDTRRRLVANATTLSGAGTYTLNTTLDVNAGRITGSAAGTSIVKLGAGRLILDNAAAAGSENDLTGATFDLQEGTLRVVGNSVAGSTNPLGSSTVSLNGGALELDTAFGDVAFANSIVLNPAGPGGTIRAVSGPRNFTLSNTTPIAIGATQALTLDSYNGSNNAAGSVLLLAAPLTGTGALNKTQTSAGNGSQNGIAVLTVDSPSYSGQVTVSGGALEGRFATVASTPFGTNPTINMTGGFLNLRGGEAATATYAVGKDLSLTGNAGVDVNRYVGTAVDSTFALGALITDGPRTFTMNSGNGFRLTFTGATLGGSTTLNVNGGTLTPGPLTFLNQASSLIKGGAGTLSLGGDNVYNGSTTLNGGVTIAPVIADTGASSIGSGNLVFQGGTLRYTGTSDVVTNRTHTATNTTAGSGLDVTNAGTRYEITSAFAGNSTNPFIKSGPGTLVISGATDNNNFGLNVQGGVVELNKSTAGGTRAVSGISNIATGATVRLTGAGTDQIYGNSNAGVNGAVNMTGGTLDLNGKSEAIDRLTGTGTVVNDGGTGTTSVLSVGEQGGSGTFSGALRDGAAGGTLALRKIGAGTTTLTGVGSYTGDTTISAGTLRVTNGLVASGAAASLWLDASDASTVQLNGTSVAAWNDKSGNGRNAVQGTAANQPSAYGENIVANGNNVVSFTGSGQLLPVDLSFLNNSAYTMFVVEGKKGTGNHYFLGTQTAMNNQGLHVGYRTDTNYTLAQYGNDLQYIDTGLAYTGTQVFRVWENVLNTATGGGHSIALDGVTRATNTSLVPLTNAGPGVVGGGFNGAGTQYIGDLGEILIFNTALSAAQRTQINAYLAFKWQGGETEQAPLGSTSAVNITASGATLDVLGIAQPIGSLTGVAGSSVTLTGAASSLSVGSAGNTAFAGSISGAGSFAKVEGAELVLTGANTYTGTTTVSGGSLLVDGSIDGSTLVTVTDTGVLGGTGTVGATAVDVNVLGGGIVSPGSNGIGELKLGASGAGNSVTFGDAGQLRIEVDAAGTASDRLTIAGDLDLSSGLDQLTIALLNGLPTGTTYTIATYAGTLTGVFDMVTGLPSGYSIDYGSGVNGAIVLVPEPTTGLTLLAAAATLALRRRRKS